jgi:acyl-protein synthetase LuxE
MIHPLEKKILNFLVQPEESEFENLALEIHGYQRRHNAAFSRYCDFLGIPWRLNSWREIPGVPQQAFKQSELRSFARGPATFEFRTSGTTGEGYGQHLLPSLNLYETAIERGWDYFDLPRHEFVLLMENPDDAPHSSLSWMGGVLSRFDKEAFFLAGDGKLELDRLMETLVSRSAPIVLFGTALSFLNLFEQAPGLGCSLCAGSLIMETGGFKGTNRDIAKVDLYAQISDHFGLPVSSIWNEYGMTELSSQFYSSGVGRAHRSPPWVRFQVVEPHRNEEAAPGEIGLLRIFDLANLWSVLAVQTQDLAIAQPAGGFLLLGRDPRALPRGCSRAIDEMLRATRSLA